MTGNLVNPVLLLTWCDVVHLYLVGVMRSTIIWSHYPLCEMGSGLGPRLPAVLYVYMYIWEYSSATWQKCIFMYTYSSGEWCESTVVQERADELWYAQVAYFNAILLLLPDLAGN